MATPQGSTPEQSQSDESHSSTNNSAEITDESQSSNEEDNQFFGNDESQEEEQDETSDGAPSQTTQSDDDTNSEESNDETDSVDPELKKWADSQNISLETDTEIKLAKRLRDTQKGFHEAKAESKSKFQEATNELSGGDQITADTLKLARMEFFMDNPDAKALEDSMYQIAVDTLNSGDKAGFAYYQTPAGWKTLLKVAKANQAEVQSEDSYDAGRKDERTNLAKKQQAKAPSAHANNSAPTDNKVTDEKIANMSLAQYNKFRSDNPDWSPFGN